MDWKIPFSGRSHNYTESEESEVLRVMRSGTTLTQGLEKEKFEKIFCQLFEVPNAFALCNATAGLELAAELCDLDSNDDVLIPTHTFTSSAYPFARQGANIIWTDMDPETRVSQLEQYEARRTPNTKVAVIVHLYGYAVEMPSLREWADQYGILLVEDNAQALGASRDEWKTGQLGDFSVCSFHSHKNLTTLGEGGILTAKNPELAKLVPLLRHNGHAAYSIGRPHYWKPAMGDLQLPRLGNKMLIPHNFCLGEVECAIGTMLLGRFEKMNDEKRTRALNIIDSLKDIDTLQFHRVDNKSHTYHLLVAEMPTPKMRDQFLDELSGKYKIQGVVQYNPLHRYPLYKDLGFGTAECPNADSFFDRMISFPFQHTLTNEEVTYTIESVQKIVKNF
jgi:perosamine synthetase